MQKQGVTQEAAESDYEKGLKIEQEFADYFTGNYVCFLFLCSLSLSLCVCGWGGIILLQQFSIITVHLLCIAARSHTSVNISPVLTNCIPAYVRMYVLFVINVKVTCTLNSVHIALIEGDTLKEMYERVKIVIKEQSGFHIWVPSGENV